MSRRAPSDGPHRSQGLGWLTWSSLGLGAQGVGQFVLLAVLARHLTAEEFGILTATLIVIGLGRSFTHASIGPALVQRHELRPEHVRTGFALAVITAVLMVAVLWAAAPATARFFRMEPLADVMRALALVFVFQAPAVVPEALLQRDMNLRALAVAEMVSFLGGFVPIGIALAVGGLGIWALVAAHVGQTLIKTVVVVARRPHERSLLPDPRATRELLFFSGGFVAARLFNYGASEGDNFVVGRWMSAADLGIYGRAYQLMAMPAMFLGEVIDRVLFPLMARAQRDPDRLCATYGRGVALIVSIMAPVAAAGIAVAPEIVRIVLGQGWDEVIAPLQVLLAGLVFRTGYKISDSLARATGTVYARAWRQALFATLVIGGALLGTRHGVAGVAAGIVAALAGNYLLMAWLSLATTGMSWARFAALHVRGLLLGAAMGVAVFAVARALREASAGTLVVLAGATLLPALVFAGAAWRSPQRVLGRDGLWLIEKLTGRVIA